MSLARQILKEGFENSLVGATNRYDVPWLVDGSGLFAVIVEPKRIFSDQSHFDFKAVGFRISPQVDVVVSGPRNDWVAQFDHSVGTEVYEAESGEVSDVAWRIVSTWSNDGVLGRAVGWVRSPEGMRSMEMNGGGGGTGNRGHLLVFRRFGFMHQKVW